MGIREDTDFLIELFSAFSPYGAEEAVRDIILAKLDEMGLPYSIDSKGNVFGLSYKNKPILSAHMDTVNRIALSTFKKHKKNISVDKTDKGFTAIHTNGSMVLGGDDRCGIFAVLRLLEKFPKSNFLFSVKEEIGAQGARHFVKEQDLSLVSYGLVLDRMGFYDIICSANGYGSKQLEDVLCEIGKPYGMRAEHGIFSDCNALKDQISCANISVGYKRPHSPNEYCLVEGVLHTIEYVASVIKGAEGMTFAPFINIKQPAGEIEQYNLFDLA